MKRLLLLVAGIGLLCAALSARGETVYYVWADSPIAGDGSAWTNAFQTIQDGVDAAVDGDLVLVTNGFYTWGGAATPGYTLQNRVCITNAITVRSVNGPPVTIIEGTPSGWSDGPGAARGVCIMTNALLDGFTITDGHTEIAGDPIYDQSGGGVFCASGLAGPTVSNCVIHGNTANLYGGGTVGGLFFDCVVSSNRAQFHGGGSYSGVLVRTEIVENTAFQNGAGAYEAGLDNCLVTENYASDDGGGAWGGSLTNCTISLNTAFYDGDGVYGANVYGCIAWHNTGGVDLENCATISHTCSSDVIHGASGNILALPLFVDYANGDFRLQRTSPCIDRGQNAFVGGARDFEGNDRIQDGDGDGTPTVDMGCYERAAAPVIVITDPPTNIVVSGAISTFDVEGSNSAAVVGTMAWTNEGTGSAGTLAAATNWIVDDIDLAFGDNDIVVSGTNLLGDSTSDTVRITRRIEHLGASSIHYVAPGGGAVWPYTNWVDAATTIQDAVDAASTNDTVLVTNGVYSTGGAVTPDYLASNRVCITRPMTVRSVNGPSNTTIVGASHYGGHGGTAVRGVCIMTNALLSGFTITNGYTHSEGDWEFDQSGGGVFCANGSAGVVSNCVIAGNAANAQGGGTAYALVYHSILATNIAPYGGGATYGMLSHCLVSNNWARWQGGGGYWTDMGNSLLVGNTSQDGGGATRGTLRNCTITGNSANAGDGAYAAHVVNCIAWYNDVGHDLYSMLSVSNTCSPSALQLRQHHQRTPLHERGPGRLPASEHLSLHRCRQQ